MITAKLQGGLGNQMFQISAAYGLSREVGTETIFDFKQCYTPNQGFMSTKYLNNLFKKINNKELSHENFLIFNEVGFNHNKLSLIHI